MHKLTIICILALAPHLFAGVPNSITITDLAGTEQTNRPFTISRVFARGEFPAGTYPQARINGSALTTQADVKSTWPDGSARHVLISFLITIRSKVRVTVDFVPQDTGNNTGYLDKNAILNYGGGAWGAGIELANPSTEVADIRRILADWDDADGGPNGSGVRYWLKGKVCTQVIVEDRTSTLRYDIGWNSSKALHPIFVATFYPGSGVSGVRIDYLVENSWIGKPADQSYSVVLKAGSPLAPVYSKPLFTHSAFTRWHKQYWSGPAPRGWKDEGHPGIKIDYNLAYLAYSKAIPNFDTSVKVSGAVIENDYAAFTHSDRCDLGGHGLWTPYMPQSGGREDIGLIPAWYARYLFSFDPKAYAVLVGQAECAASVPFHYRESSPSKVFNAARTEKAFGLPLSIDARPTVYLGNLDYDYTRADDKITPVGRLSTNHWDYDLAHLPAFSYIPYLITGEYFFLEELQFQASTDLARAGPGVSRYSRHDSWGFFNDTDVQTRGQAWGRRDIAEAAFASPTGSYVGIYFTEKTNSNIAVEEGLLNITNGSFYQNCTTSPYDETRDVSKWCWGRRTAGINFPGPNPLCIDSTGNDSNITESKFVPEADSYAPILQDAFYQHAYKFQVMGHIQDLGFNIGKLNETAFKFVIHVLADPDFNPWLINSDEFPTVRKSTRRMYDSWSAVLTAFSTDRYRDSSGRVVNLRTVRHWFDNASDDASGDGYPHLWQAAASYSVELNDGAVTGQAAWDWTVKNVSRRPFAVNPQYAVLPRPTGSANNRTTLQTSTNLSAQE